MLGQEVTVWDPLACNSVIIASIEGREIAQSGCARREGAREGNRREGREGERRREEESGGEETSPRHKGGRQPADEPGAVTSGSRQRKQTAKLGSGIQKEVAFQYLGRRRVLSVEGCGRTPARIRWLSKDQKHN